MRNAATSALLVLLATGVAAAQPPKAALTASPIEVIGRLAESKLTPVEPFAGAERAALEAVWAARTGPKPKTLPQADATAVTAHLRAGGVTDAEVIAKYIKTLDALVADADTATRNAKNPREKADKLLRFLHQGVMAKGYDAEQSSLHAVFDTGKFNCVSSAALYYLVGTRLGLELVGVNIPGGWLVAGHATTDLIDGKNRVQIEPTSADGFEADVKAKRPNVIIVGPQPDRTKGRDCDGYGLAASAASNRGVGAAKASPPRRGEAIRCYAAALTLDPANPTAAQNLLAEFSNWGTAAAKRGDFEEAVAVYAFALDVLADKKELRRNHEVIWSWYLDAEFSAGRYEQGLKVLDRARKAIPDETRFRNAAVWVTRACEKKTDKDGWVAGLEAADVALKAVPEAAQKEIREWKDRTRRRWSQKLLDKGDVDGSVKVIAEGLAVHPDSQDLARGLENHTYDALAYLVKTKGVGAAAEHLATLRKQFPKNAQVNEVARKHALGTIEKLSDEKKYAESVKAAADYKDFAADPEELIDHAYHWWGLGLTEDKKWEAALAVYAEGLKLVKKGKGIRRGVERTVDTWADPAIDAKNWAEAIRIYDVGLKLLPKNTHLEHNKSVCEKRRDK